MSKVTMQELNEVMLSGFKDMLSSHDDFKDREFCITALAKDGRGNYVGILIDVDSSLGFNFSVSHKLGHLFTKTVFEGIARKLATRIVLNAKTQPYKKYDWNKTPMKAKGRTSIYEGCTQFTGGKGKLHLLSWSKIITK
ncbi:hypothetical protein LCGC14_0305890 [marine sediment metagenome]|uniref:Uncharacterized protein n=1 Tax=marine sediment metagenome TaxID=412755 RepID=A0A0F9TNY7_9ZZZZ